MLHSNSPRVLVLATVALGAAACTTSDLPKTPKSTDSVAAAPVVVQPAASGTPDSAAAVPESVSYAMADSAYTARDYGRAADLFDAYAKRRPENPWGFYMLGLSSWKAGQLDRARGAFQDALQLDPKNVKSMVNLSRVLLEQDRPQDALVQVRAALAVDSGSVDAWRVLGRVEGRIGHLDDALTAYHTALSLDPQDTWSMNNMGLLLIGAGRYEEALGPLARAVQLDEHGVPAFENNLGIALERTGHATLAAEAYRKALESDSTYARAQVSLARVSQLADDSTADSVTVASLGDAFASQVSSWQSSRDVAAVPHAADTTRTPVTPVTTAKPDSMKPPQP